tara:strand:- start:97 stop:498 length:402 start_codon:yes stop_codon:yes gene_type:complete
MKAKEPKDKRTNEYKKWKKSKGLGDTIDKITKATGIKKVVDLLFDDCGCDKRKEKLNKMFPYKVECLEENEYLYLKEIYSKSTSRLNITQREALLIIYNKTFNKNQKQTSCSSCWISMLRELKVIYNEYETKE